MTIYFLAVATATVALLFLILPAIPLSHRTRVRLRMARGRLAALFATLIVGCGAGPTMGNSGGTGGGSAGATTTSGMGGHPADGGGDACSTNAPCNGVCTDSFQCPDPGPLPQCVSVICDPGGGHPYDDAGPIGCAIVSTSAGAPCDMPDGGGMGRCEYPGDASTGPTVCCPFSGAPCQ